MLAEGSAVSQRFELSFSLIRRKHTGTRDIARKGLDLGIKLAENELKVQRLAITCEQETVPVVDVSARREMDDLPQSSIDTPLEVRIVMEE